MYFVRRALAVFHLTHTLPQIVTHVALAVPHSQSPRPTLDKQDSQKLVNPT